jgi:ABC-type branched-subunit amino acid transport system ATPase component
MRFGKGDCMGKERGGELLEGKTLDAPPSRDPRLPPREATPRRRSARRGSSGRPVSSLELPARADDARLGLEPHAEVLLHGFRDATSQREQFGSWKDRTTLPTELQNWIGQFVSEMENAPAEVRNRRIGFIFQNFNLIQQLTVLENLGVGGMIGKRSREERMAEVFELFPDLKALQSQKAGTLSGGESRMVACGRALMQDPKVLLLDEPTAGLSPRYVDMFFDKIRQIHETRGVAIILAEQNATKALQVADRVMVLSLGEAFSVMDAAHLTTRQLKEGYRI